MVVVVWWWWWCGGAVVVVGWWWGGGGEVVGWVVMVGGGEGVGVWVCVGWWWMEVVWEWWRLSGSRRAVERLLASTGRTSRAVVTTRISPSAPSAMLM